MTRLFNKRLINIEEYHKMAEAGILNSHDKVELINGEIIHMSPIGSKHQSVVDKLTYLFNRGLQDKAIIRVQGPIQIKDWSEPEPDITLLKTKSDFYSKQHPKSKDIYLVVEVADSSLEFDKEVKLPIYAKAKIKEYWIVNLIDNQIEIYHTPQDDIYKQITIAKIGDKISCKAFSKKLISVKDILE